MMHSSMVPYLFTVYLAVVISESVPQIFRSACRRDVLMRATDYDKQLVGIAQNVIAEIHASKLASCVKNCMVSDKCLTINYKKFPAYMDENNCQLLSISKSSDSASLSHAEGWIHYEPANQAGPRCRLAGCNPGFRCSETCAKQEGFECIDIDECASTPCQNGGTCADDVNQYTCSCAPGYAGSQCQTSVDECASTPCQNGGTCADGVNQYTCSCAPGYAGSQCQTSVDECASTPCQNGGTCADGVNQYTCSCAPGYAGSQCQTSVDECASTPCQNGGTCADGVNQYTCSCAPGYAGSQCQTSVDECASTPCQNGGTCADGVNQYTCSCAPGYAGSQCQTNVDECASTPCQNGGTCADGVNQYTCSCAPGYAGSQCQTSVDECASTPCQNGGTCADGVNQYTCSCAPGYAGSQCQTIGRKSCSAHYLAGYRSNGIYQIIGESGVSFQAYCDMGAQGWTLIARFSNKDGMNWMQNSGAFWYDQQVFGAPTSPSTNADMISRAFFDVKGSDVKISRSDISSHASLLYAGTCLSQQTFRDKLTSYGNFRNNARWLPSNDGCRGHCTIHSYGAKTGVSGFSQSACSGTVQSSNQLGFWCHYSSGDGAVLMIGGGGSACGRADHGIGITEANAPQFDVASGAKDFGDDNAGSSVYSLNLWIR